MHAGIDRHQLRPAEVFEFGSTDHLGGLNILDGIEFTARLQAAQQHIGDGGKRMHKLAVRRIADQCKRDDGVRPPDHLMHAREHFRRNAAQRRRQRIRDERPQRPRVMRQRQT